MRLLAKIGATCFFCGGAVMAAALAGLHGPKIDVFLALAYVGLNLVTFLCVLILGVAHGAKLLGSRD